MRHVTLNGGKVEYLWQGPPPDVAPTLVFLHEGLGSAGMWRDFPARLAQATGCSALTYSRFGYGGSAPCPLPRPLTYHTDEATRILPELLERLGVGRHVLIGHSDGATIALINAGVAPAPSLLAVIAEAPHVFVEDVVLTGIAKTRARYPLGLRDALHRHHGANVDIAFQGWADTWLNPDFRAWNVEAVLPAITVPVLVIQGHEDEYATLAQVERVAEGTGAETMVLENCGHAPHRDHPDLVRAAMAGFIRRARDQNAPLS